LSKIIHHNVILITGANAGLGWELLQSFLPVARKIYALDIQINKLEELKSEKVVVLKIDLSEPLAINSLFSIHDFSDVTVLINNAGITAIKPLQHTDIETFRKLMEVNFFAPVLLTNLLLHQNLKSIININSVAGKAPLYARSAYCASKHALDGLMRTLAVETKVTILNIYPSFINTGIRVRAVSEGKKGMATQTSKQMNPQLVAQKILKAWQKGKQKLIIGWVAHGAIWLQFIFPALYNMLMLRQNKKIWKS
jgi:short-subunit dehydrogenase